MSRLIDKLKKLSQAAPSPMGFRTTHPAKAGSPLLIIGRTLIKTTASAAKSNSGADAVLVYADKSELTAVSAQKTAKAFGDIPWGVYLEESDEAAAALGEAIGLPPVDMAHCREMAAALANRGEAFVTAQSAGRAMTLEEAVAFALAEDVAGA